MALNRQVFRDNVLGGVIEISYDACEFLEHIATKRIEIYDLISSKTLRP